MASGSIKENNYGIVTISTPIIHRIILNTSQGYRVSFIAIKAIKAANQELEVNIKQLLKVKGIIAKVAYYIVFEITHMNPLKKRTFKYSGLYSLKSKLTTLTHFPNT